MDNKRTRWDNEKAKSNLFKHDVSFDEAQSVFDDPLALVLPDERIEYEERRWFAIGMSAAGKLLAVWYTERGDVIRIIGARRASKSERRNYENERII
jgi:uncharacterized DUF497 family protein